MKINIGIFTICMFICILYGQWPGEIQVTNTLLKERVYPNNWSIAITRDPVSAKEIPHLVWQGWTSTTDTLFEIYYAQILGLTAPRPITSISGSLNAIHPSIAVSGNNIHVAYVVNFTEGFPFEGDIYYIRSTNNGITWSTPSAIYEHTYGQDLSHLPSIAVSGNIVHIVWDRGHDYPNHHEVNYKRSTDNGISWSENPVNLYEVPQSFWAVASCIAVSNNFVHVAWHSSWPNGHNDVFYRHSTDYGATWTDPAIQISENNGRSPSIAVRGNNAYVVWTDMGTHQSNAEVFFDYSNDNGNSWRCVQHDSLLSIDDDNPSQDPCVAVNHDFVFVVYQDTKNTSSPVHSELWCTRSSDQGYHWTGEQVTVNNGKYSQAAAIAVLSQTLHVVWDEEQTYPTNYDIYYNKKTYISPLYSTGSSDFPLNAQQLSATIIRLTGQLQATGPVTVRLFNSLGQLVKKTIHTPASKDLSFAWQTGDLPKGVYFLQLSQAHGWQKNTRVIILDR